MKIWNGSSWQKVGAAFADNAASANVTIASGAIVANSAIVASGALGAVIASGALAASGALGAVASSGSLEANLASGINVVTALPAAYTGGIVYLNAGVSGIYVSANGGWILV
jgi:acyl dehydratase